MKRPGRDRGDSLTGANFSFPLLGRRDLRREGNSLIKLAMSKKTVFDNENTRTEVYGFLKDVKFFEMKVYRNFIPKHKGNLILTEFHSLLFRGGSGCVGDNRASSLFP